MYYFVRKPKSDQLWRATCCDHGSQEQKHTKTGVKTSDLGSFLCHGFHGFHGGFCSCHVCTGHVIGVHPATPRSNSICLGKFENSVETTDVYSILMYIYILMYINIIYFICCCLLLNTSTCFLLILLMLMFLL